MALIGKSLSLQVSKIATERSANAIPMLVSSFGFTGTASAGQSNPRTELGYEELSDLLLFNEDLSLIDVRTAHELTTYGSIPGAVNIPLSEMKAALQLSAAEFQDTFFLPKPLKSNRNLIFFARGPNASSAAVEIAHRLGYKGSRQYSGGWEDYCKKTGIPLKKVVPIKDTKTSPFMGRPSFEAYNTFAPY